MTRHLKEDGSCPRAVPGTISPNEDNVTQEGAAPLNVVAQPGGSTSSTSTSTFTDQEANRIAAQIRSGKTTGKLAGKTWVAYKAQESYKPWRQGGGGHAHRCGRCNFSTDFKHNLQRHIKNVHRGGESGEEGVGPEDDRDVPGAGAAAGKDGGGDRQGQAETAACEGAAGAADMEESMADSSPDNIIDVSDNEDDIGDASDNAAETDEQGNPVFRSPFKRKPSQRREPKK